MSIHETIPRFDLPIDYIVDDNITGQLLELYKMFPCKIKAGIFALCTQGEVKVTLNLADYVVSKNDFIVLIPGSFIQIHNVAPDTSVSFIGFSSDFINNVNFWRNVTGNLSGVLNNPIIKLPECNAEFFKDLFTLLTRAFAKEDASLLNKEVMVHFTEIIYNTLGNIYNNLIKPEISKQPREYEILGEFLRLSFENYQTEHKASFYANEVGVTLSHFCASIKKATGKTAQDIIRELIITDAKAQLKSSNSKINKIAQSLGFTPSSFNRYFLEYVKMTPLDYRNS